MPLDDASAGATQVQGRTSPSFEPPSIDDGTDLWQLVIDSKTLDVNSRYSYLLWCRDFAATSIVARTPEGIGGFITGYRRPDADNTLFVWQVATATHMRRQGLARRMLDHLFARQAPLGVDHVEATVTPDNLPSAGLFESFAKANNATLTRDELFTEEMLGKGHEPEVRFRIGPISRTA
ncbi:MAG TPA: diaminobutyrate acetyltransferase [Candidatus Stackebrandtia faecavium]|nr:diaminobutyrate acetyltransferase [Candidatus Stackebrandtia faecavium]